MGRNKQIVPMSSNRKMNTIFFISLALLTIRINSYLNSPPIFLPHYHHTFSTRQQLSSLSTFSNRVRRRPNGNNNGGSLEQRLRDINKQDQKKSSVKRQSAVKVVHTLDEFKKLLKNEGKDNIIIVRFLANWCKACKSTTPYYYSMANRHNNESNNNNICFVDVPITDKNVDLHQGLGIPSIPYGHIYIPNNNNKDGLLVEEFRMK